MSLRAGFSTQLEVVHALVLRETRTRFGRNRLGYLWALLEPLLWVGTFYASFVVTHRHVPAGMDTVGFLATGTVTFELFSKTTGRVSEAINSNRSLLFYPQVHPLDLTLARATLEGSTLIAVFVILLSTNALLFPEARELHEPLKVVLGLLLALGLGGSFGLLLCMLGVFSNTVERIRGPMMRPLFWVSGLFFTLSEVPARAREPLLLNPVLHTVEIVRDGWFESYEATYADPLYVVWFILSFSLAGLLLERAARRRVELS